MKEDQLTPWFPAEVKPVRKGLYMTSMDNKGYSWWSGKEWGIQYEDRMRAAFFSPGTCGSQQKQWRGLRSKL